MGKVVESMGSLRSFSGWGVSGRMTPDSVPAMPRRREASKLVPAPIPPPPPAAAAPVEFPCDMVEGGVLRPPPSSSSLSWVELLESSGGGCCCSPATKALLLISIESDVSVVLVEPEYALSRPGMILRMGAK